MKNGHYISLFLLAFGCAMDLFSKNLFEKVPTIVFAISGVVMFVGTLMGFIMMLTMPKKATLVDDIK